MASNGNNGAADVGRFAKWAWAKATSRPIKKIEDTLATGKPPQDQPAAPESGIPPSTLPRQMFRRYGPRKPDAKKRSRMDSLKAALTKK